MLNAASSAVRSLPHSPLRGEKAAWPQPAESCCRKWREVNSKACCRWAIPSPQRNSACSGEAPREISSRRSAHAGRGDLVSALVKSPSRNSSEPAEPACFSKPLSFSTNLRWRPPSALCVSSRKARIAPPEKRCSSASGPGLCRVQQVVTRKRESSALTDARNAFRARFSETDNGGSGGFGLATISTRISAKLREEPARDKGKSRAHVAEGAGSRCAAHRGFRIDRGEAGRPESQWKSNRENNAGAHLFGGTPRFVFHRK